MHRRAVKILSIFLLCLHFIESYQLLGLEGTLRINRLQAPATSRAANHYIKYQISLPRTPFNLAFNTSRDRVSPASLGSPFQHLTTLSFQ